MPTAPASPPPLLSTRAVRTQREFECECIHLFSEVVETLGVPRSVGQIYGLLFASAQPLCFSDIVERLEISKGSASQGLQFLRTLGAIKRSSTGGRFAGRPFEPTRDYYDPELSLRKLVSGVLQERIAPLAVAGADRIARIRRLAEENDKQDDFLLGRVKQLETWRRRFRTVLPVLGVLLGPKRE